MKWRIAWYAQDTGDTGQGPPVFDTKETAEHVSAQLNKMKRNVGILHWVESIPPNLESAEDYWEKMTRAATNACAEWQHKYLSEKTKLRKANEEISRLRGILGGLAGKLDAGRWWEHPEA